jgi:hypothetical protein
MRQPAILAITVRRCVPQSDFSRRKITLRYAALSVIGAKNFSTPAKSGMMPEVSEND